MRNLLPQLIQIVPEAEGIERPIHREHPSLDFGMRRGDRSLPPAHFDGASIQPLINFFVARLIYNQFY